MSRYRKIDPRIWNDEKFRAFSDDGKLAFLFILTHPHMTSLGAMRATLPGLASEIGWHVTRFLDAIREAIRDGLLEVNEDACYVGAPNFLRYNEPEGPNSVKLAWVEALDLVPECPEKNLLITRVRKYLNGKSDAFRLAIGVDIWDAFPDAIPVPIPRPMSHPGAGAGTGAGAGRVLPSTEAAHPRTTKTRLRHDKNGHDAPTNAVWRAYCVAYKFRYQAEPVRNATINGQLARFLARVPADEAPMIAAAYVGNSNQTYVRGGHSIGLLLRDAEKLRTEWFTGQRVTEAKARDLDHLQTQGDEWRDLLVKASEGDAAPES